MTGYVGSPVYGLYAPFSQTTSQLQLSGVKPVVIPAGVQAIFQMAVRKSVSGAVAAINYSNMQVKPVRWV
jgi:hypothetical protein